MIDCGLCISRARCLHCAFENALICLECILSRSWSIVKGINIHYVGMCISLCIINWLNYSYTCTSRMCMYTCKHNCLFVLAIACTNFRDRKGYRLTTLILSYKVNKHEVHQNHTQQHATHPYNSNQCT